MKSPTQPTTVNARRMQDSVWTPAIILVAMLASFTPTQAQAPSAASRDVYCGPRCVQRVLEYYGKDQDLFELVRQIQWPVSSTGATLEQLQQVLQSRGIETRAVEVAKSANFQWSHPAIFHLKFNDLAHYVVWLPPRSKNANPTIWGASFNHRFTTDEFLQARTGVVLLTSAAPIPENPRLFVAHAEMSISLWVFVSVAGAFVAAAYWTKSTK